LSPFQHVTGVVVTPHHTTQRKFAQIPLYSPKLGIFQLQLLFWGWGVPGLYITTPKLQAKKINQTNMATTYPRNPNPKPFVGDKNQP
jgi:hypothetical protein